jgi:streptogramin lyase
MYRRTMLAFTAIALCCVVLPAMAGSPIKPGHAVRVRSHTAPVLVNGLVARQKRAFHTKYAATVTTIKNGGAFSAAYNTFDGNYYLVTGEFLYRLTPSGQSSEFARLVINGYGDQIVWDPHSLLLYVTVPSSYEILSVAEYGTVTVLAGGTRGTADGTGTAAQFQGPSGLTLDPAHHQLWVVDNDRLRSVSEAGVVVTVGPTQQFTPVFGQNGGLTDAFDTRTGDIAVADAGQNVIHLFHASTVTYSTLAGRCVLQTFGCLALHSDGRGTDAIFGSPSGIAYDPGSDAFYVADYPNNDIRKVDTRGNVTTFAGGGAQVMLDGVGLGAGFVTAQCASLNPDLKSLVVCDAGSVRLVTLSGVPAPPPANAIGMLRTPTLVSSPSGIAATSDGSIWYAEQASSYIGRVFPDGHQKEYVLPPKIGMPFNVAADSLGNVWFGDLGGFDRFGNPTKAFLAQMTPTGRVHESPLQFPCDPYGTHMYTYTLTPDSSGNIWFTNSCRGLLGFSTQQFNLTGYVTVGVSPIATSPDAFVWAAWWGNGGEILKFARDGSLLATYTNIRGDGGLAWGKDAHVWFLSGGTIGNLDPATGAAVTFNLANCGCNRGNLTVAPDGALWFTEVFPSGSSSSYSGGVGRFTTAGVYTEYGIYEPRSKPVAIAFDSSGRLWVADFGANKIGRLKP